TGRDAPIAIAIKHMPLVIHGDLIEVEKIAIVVTTALLPDAGHALNRIVWSCVDRGPRSASVISRGDEHVPFPGETRCLIITGDIRPQKTNSGAASTAANCLDVRGVHDAVRCSQIEIDSNNTIYYSYVNNEPVASGNPAEGHARVAVGKLNTTTGVITW